MSIDSKSTYFSNDETYYDILNINKDASQLEIRNAYNKLAYKLDPTINHEISSNRRFMDICNAYQILANPELKHKYDISLIDNSIAFECVYRNPYDIFKEFQEMKMETVNKFSNIDNILKEKIKNKYTSKAPMRIILSKEVIILNDKPYEKLVELDKDGVEYITYIHPNGSRQRVISDESLFSLIKA
jgi:curved DNA-binding protein CbpA